MSDDFLLRVQGKITSEEYVRRLRLKVATRRLAANRARRMATGRPVLDLTAQEIEASTRTAMRLADALPDQPSQSSRS